MSNQQKEHNLRYLSGNLRATATVLTQLKFRASSSAGYYTIANATDVNYQIKGLLANIEFLIEAAKAVQSISRPITEDVLKASVYLRDRMRQNNRDLESCLGGSEDDIIRTRRPCYIYNRTIPRVIDIVQKYYTIMHDLRFRVEAELLMQTEEEMSTEPPPPIKVGGLWHIKGGSFELLRELDSNPTRSGVPATKTQWHNVKDWLRNRRKRKDIAATLSYENGKIKTTMPHRTMFSEK